MSKKKGDNPLQPKPARISKLLIANRGEIAMRIMRTVGEMGISTVAVYSEADRHALFTTVANESVCIGGNTPAESYLDQDKIIEAAKRTEADAIHPGYGFLAENAAFAQRCADEGITFIGPSPEVISLLGSKIKAKEIAQRAGVPIVPGYNGTDQAIGRFKYEAEEIGYPVLLKASAGGGGKGMRIVYQADELETAFESAKREAESSFGDGSLLLEKYFTKAKHIEFQIVGDLHGNYINMFDRECSLQRRYQKIVEESPSPSLNDELRTEMGEAALAIAREVNYTNLGTVEFLLDENQNFYFLEVNTRLQVEHPVTEMVIGIDLVGAQMLVCTGSSLDSLTETVQQRGHSIECRICAEDPENKFLPSTGTVFYTQHPNTFSLRSDTGIDSLSTVPAYYDSLLSKLIVITEDRASAIQKMVNALSAYPILGVTTNKDFLKELIQHPSFIDGSFDTNLIEREFSSYKKIITQTSLHEAAIAATIFFWICRNESERFEHSLNGWRNIPYQPQIIELENNGTLLKVEYLYRQKNRFSITIQNENYEVVYAAPTRFNYRIEVDSHSKNYCIAGDDLLCYIHHPTAGTFHFEERPRFIEPYETAFKNRYTAPMPGEILKVIVKPGDYVKSGTVLLIMNSMKMETTIEAASDGEVEEVYVIEKSFVEAGAELLKLKANSDK